MSSSALKLLLGGLLGALLLLLTSRAGAAEFVVTLETDPDAVPDVACFVGGLKPGADLRKEEVVPFLATMKASGSPEVVKQTKSILADLERWPKPSLDGVCTTEVIFSGAFSAREAMCVRNLRERADDGPRRILIFDLLNTAQPKDLFFVLAGSGLTITGSFNASLVGIRTFGGSYEPEQATTFDRRARLPLRPICVERTVRLPDAQGGPYRARFRAHGPRKPEKAVETSAEDDVRCVGACTESGLQRVVLKREWSALSVCVFKEPVEARGAAKKPTTDTTDPCAPEGARGDVAEYEVEWPQSVPPTPLELRATRFPFRWHSSCLVPVQEVKDCPLASIPSAGVACRAVRAELILGEAGRRCVYECSSSHRVGESAKVGFVLPAKAQLSVGPQKDVWQEDLVYMGQVVDSSADRATRQFPIAFPWEETDTKKPASWYLQHVDLSPGAGAPFRVSLDSKAYSRMTIPGATCHDAVRYRYWGEFQSFRTDSVQIEGGRLEVPSPYDTFDHWWFGARLSLSYLFVAAFEGKSSPRPNVEAEAFAQFRPYDASWALEFPLAYAFGQKEVSPVGLERGDDEARATLVNRFFVVPRMMGVVRDQLYVGGGVGFMIDWPALTAQQGLVGTLGGAFAGDVLVRYVPIPIFSLHVAGRMLLGDRIRVLSADPGASAAFKNDEVAGFALQLGMGFWGAI